MAGPAVGRLHSGRPGEIKEQPKLVDVLSVRPRTRVRFPPPPFTVLSRPSRPACVRRRPRLKTVHRLALPRWDPMVDAPDGKKAPREVLREHRLRMLDHLAERGASNVRIFGSLARGDDDGQSDIDLLVELPD